MANYKNTRGRSYAQQRRSSSGGILKTLGAVLVVFLAIGLIGSLFSRPSDSADADKKDPTTATESPTEVPEMITFSAMGLGDYQAEAGMTFAEWCESDYSYYVNGNGELSKDHSINDQGNLCHIGYGELMLDGATDYAKGRM